MWVLPGDRIHSLEGVISGHSLDRLPFFVNSEDCPRSVESSRQVTYFFGNLIRAVLTIALRLRTDCGKQPDKTKGCDSHFFVHDSSNLLGPYRLRLSLLLFSPHTLPPNVRLTGRGDFYTPTGARVTTAGPVKRHYRVDICCKEGL